MTPLLYFASCFSLCALFASAIAATFWAFLKLVRLLTTSPAERRRRREVPVDLHHLKRAGQ
jgi:hypothetical protein